MVPYLHVTYALYVLFLLLMVITLTNLITGIAVGDVGAIQSEVQSAGVRTQVSPGVIPPEKDTTITYVC